MAQCAGADLRRGGCAAAHRRPRTGFARANATGRPFTGDYAGDLLYSTLIAFGFARGEFRARADDGLTLRIAASPMPCVRAPAKQARTGGNHASAALLEHVIAEMPRLSVILVLGQIAHQSTVRALGEKAVARAVQAWR